MLLYFSKLSGYWQWYNYLVCQFENYKLTPYTIHENKMHCWWNSRSLMWIGHSLMSSARIKLLTEYVLLTWQTVTTWFLLHTEDSYPFTVSGTTEGISGTLRMMCSICDSYNWPIPLTLRKASLHGCGSAKPGRWTLLDLWFPLKSYLWYLTVHCCWSSSISIYFPLGLNVIYRHLSLLRSTQLPRNSTCWDMNITSHIYSWSICLNKLT